MSKQKLMLEGHAHQMRLVPTDSEARLWQALRAKQTGVAFRRQVPVLRYIVDFLAPSARLVVEVDGAYHQRRLEADARRDERLRRAGYRVLRLDAELVLRELPRAVVLVKRALGV
jgi:very-short-patch-repair endonuclease